MNHSVHFRAIPCIIAHVTKEHMSEDDIMFTKVLGLLRVKTINPRSRVPLRTFLLPQSEGWGKVISGLDGGQGYPIPG